MIEYEWPNPPEVSCTFNICVCVCDAHMCNSVHGGHSSTQASFSMLPLWASSPAWRAVSRLIWISSHKPPKSTCLNLPDTGVAKHIPPHDALFTCILRVDLGSHACSASSFLSSLPRSDSSIPKVSRTLASPHGLWFHYPRFSRTLLSLVLSNWADVPKSPGDFKPLTQP